MGFELFIAKRLELNPATSGSNKAPSLNVALVGITLALVIMILAVAVVMGFKHEITNKIYGLDSHIKITSSGTERDNTIVNSNDIFPVIMHNKPLLDDMASMSLIAEKPTILKTDNDFMGVKYKGVDDGFDWNFIKSCLVAGRIPNVKDNSAKNEIAISSNLAKKLGLKVGDKLLTYFIDDKVKVRNSHIVGIYNTNFDTFDNNFILGSIAQLQDINGWSSNVGNYVGINVRNTSAIKPMANAVYTALVKDAIEHKSQAMYAVQETHQSNASFFTWLGMLNMNVIIILVLMIAVSGFTLIAAMLMIILERVKLIGTLKALGASNKAIRKIFIYLTSKLMLKAIVLGNAIGIGLAIVQQHLHIIKLNPDAYYMPFVPISLNAGALIALNLGLIIIAYITLIGPSYFVASIKPSSTMRFE